MYFRTNPFPGMNPWLEKSWRDIHTRLTTYSCDAVQEQLPEDLQARVEEYLLVDDRNEDDHGVRSIAPDVSVIERANRLHDGDSSGALFVSEEPIRVLRVRPPQTLRCIRILDSNAGRKVVTAIEFLSQSNKATPAGRRQYVAKQSELLEAGVNLVEIDLWRAGGWVMATPQDLYPESLRYPYRVSVVRAENLMEAELYPADYRQPLPNIRIPLRPTDADVRLPLQTIVNQAYERGRYGNDIDYSQVPDPPLTAAEHTWVDVHLQRMRQQHG